MGIRWSGTQRPQERRRAPRRWEDVLSPSYRIQEPSGSSRDATQRLPRWIERARQGQLPAKDLTGGGEK